MSMISSLIDELRNVAEFYDGFKAANLILREASETIWQLRDDLQRANDAARDAEHDQSVAWDRVRKAEAENAKLRELVLELWRSCPVSESDCKMCMCPHYIEESEGDWCDISIRIDELGIEGTNDRDREGQAHRANPRDRRDP